MKMKKPLICVFILIVGGLVAISPGQAGKKVQGDSQAKAEALSRSCSAEFDDPASQEYKQCTQAIQLLEQLRTEHPQEIPILLALGRAYVNRSPQKSIEAYQKVLSLDPANVTANFQLGLLLHSPEEQIEHLRAVIAQEPNHPEAHGRLAELLAPTSQTHEAVAQIKQQLAINPDSIDVIANVIQTLTATGHKAEAAEICAAYLRSNLPAKVKCEDSRFMLKPYADQADVAAAFKEQCPGHALYKEALRHTEPRERARLLEEAIKTGDPDAKAHGELALALLQLNDVDRAISEIKEQIRIDPILGHDQITVFAAALQARNLVNEEIKVYLAYLASPAPNQFVCVPVRRLLAESGGTYRALEQSFQKRCGT